VQPHIPIHIGSAIVNEIVFAVVGAVILLLALRLLKRA